MASDDVREIARTREFLEELTGETEMTLALRQVREEVSLLRADLMAELLEAKDTANFVTEPQAANLSIESIAELRREIADVKDLLRENLESGWARQHIGNVTRDTVAELQREIAEVKQLLHESAEVGWVRQHVGNLTADAVREIRQLVGPVGITFPDDTILTRTIHGHLYYVDAHDTIITPQMLIYRQWEPDLTDLFLRLVTQNGVFVDVGANIGYFTCLVAARMGERGGRVYAFEPNPKLAPILRKNIAINWSSAPIVFHEKAVSNKSGTTMLFVPSDRGANASMGQDSARGADLKVIVPTVTLDDALPTDVDVDLLKIDIEGFELYALQGAREVIGRSSNIKIIMEWSLEQTLAAKIKPDQIIEFFEEMGFLPFAVSQNDYTFPIVDSLRWEDIRRTNYANLLLSRPKR